MVAAIALMKIFGYPAIMYGGIFVFIILIINAFIGRSISQGRSKIPIKYHMLIAWAIIILGLFHGLLGLAIIIGF